MMFFRRILWPFSLIYALFVSVRNFLYDKGLFSELIIPGKAICVGNLSTGGTGKTPHVAFLADYLLNHFETTILSRGYGRKSKGFKVVSSSDSSADVGDEPLLYAQRFDGKVHVTVCEKRVTGIQEIQKRYPSNKLIILDDAFQHRAVKAGFSILLTQFNKPYFKDFILPAGNLREPISGRKRADVIIVTKCPESVSSEEQIHFKKELKFPEESIFFSRIVYGNWTCFGKPVASVKRVLLVTGIADPEPLQHHFKKNHDVSLIKFNDHHDFTAYEIQEIHQKFDTFASEQMVILTTEKDYMRLISLKENTGMENYPWYYVPITVQLEDEKRFKELIDSYVSTI
jgi:tetraacyldisaccharide 4'-kinase